MISAYSLVMSVLFFNISLCLVYVLRKKRDFIAKYGIQILITITALGLIRLISPVDFKAAYVLRSYKLVPAIQNALSHRIAGSGIDIGNVLVAVWVAGATIFLIRDIIFILLFKARWAKYERYENAAVFEAANELGIKQRIVVTPRVAVPCVTGYFRQVIYTPPFELSIDEWKYVLMHEWQHIRSHDQLIKLLFLIIRAVFWWNPVSHRFMYELDAILELRCDYAVTKNLGEEESASYFGVILSVIKQRTPTSESRPAMNTALVDRRSRARDDIKQRFEVYRNSDHRRSKRVRNAIQIIICAAFIASYFIIVQPVIYPPEDDLIGVEGTIEDKTFIACHDNKYYMYSGGEMIMEIPAEEINSFPYNTMEIYEGGN